MLTVGEEVMHVAGFSIVTSTAVAMAHNEIGQLWEKFADRPIKEQLGELASPSVFAVYSDYENGFIGKYRVTVGYAVRDITNIPAGLTVVTVPTGSYRSFPVKTHMPEDIVATWQTIWATDPQALPRNFIADVEEYRESDVVIYIGFNK